MNSRRFISTFPQTVGEAYNLMRLLADGTFCASPALLNMGIYICPQCGYYNPVEVERCKQCKHEKFIILNTPDAYASNQIQPELEP